MSGPWKTCQNFNTQKSCMPTYYPVTPCTGRYARLFMKSKHTNDSPYLVVDEVVFYGQAKTSYPTSYPTTFPTTFPTSYPTSYPTSSPLKGGPDVHFEANLNVQKRLNRNYKPTQVKKCCHAKCGRNKACQKGCKHWLAHTTLNWYKENRALLVKQCKHSCSMKASQPAMWTHEPAIALSEKLNCHTGCATFEKCSYNAEPMDAYTCDFKKNFISGQRYSQISLTDYCKNGVCNANPKYGGANSKDNAIAYCKDTCHKRSGCTGFFFQTHGNGHEICGFYTGTVNKDAAQWHGHKNGAICFK